jgi:hypothetical protein
MVLPKSVLKIILVVISLIAVIAQFFLSPIQQNPVYHQFADQRTIFSIPNFWNVISNMAFLFAGTFGLVKLCQKRLNIIEAIQSGYFIFFAGVALVSFGSAYYHWNPSNHTLLWDRLPMTIGFMSLLAVSLAEYVSIAWGKKTLLPLLLIGFISVVYWYWGELHGNGDLRLYFLVQFLPLILLLILLLFGLSNFKNSAGFWWLFAAYTLAKFSESFDKSIFNFTGGVVAGHMIKHLLSAAGIYILLLYFEKRVSHK